MADDLAVPFELRKARGVLERAVSRDFTSLRLAGRDGPDGAAARLAAHFNLIRTGHSGDEAISRVYGPLGVNGWAQLRDDYDSVMPRLRMHIQKFTKECLDSEKKRLSLLLFLLNTEGMPERLSAAAQKIGREAGGLSLKVDWDRAQVNRAHASRGAKGNEGLIGLDDHPGYKNSKVQIATDRPPEATTPPRVPHVGPMPSLGELKKSYEDAADLKKFYGKVKDLARARIGPFVRKEPLLAILFEHPENEALNVPLGGLSILQAYANSGIAEGGALRAESHIPVLPPSDKLRAQPSAPQSPDSRSRPNSTLQSYLPAVSYVTHAGTSLASAVIRNAINALDQFGSALNGKGNEDHALRYLPFVLGGIEKSGLAKVPGFREFALVECERLGRGMPEDILDAAGLAVAYIGLLFTFAGPAGAAVVGIASFAVEAARVPFVYIREHEQELAASAGVFLGQARQWAKPPDYSETFFAALNAAAALLMGSAFYLEARTSANFLKVVGSTTGKAGAEKAAIEIADLQAGKAARTAAPQAGEWSITAGRSGQSASMARPPASGSASSPSGFAWGSTTATTDVTAASGKPASLLHMSPQQSARAIESDAITANGRPTSFERATSPGQRADIERNTYDVTTDMKTRRMKGIEKRPGPGKDVAPGTLEGLEPTMSKEVGDPTRGSVRLDAREAAAYAAGKPSGFSLSRKVFEAVYKGRLIDTGGGLSVQAGHMVAKSTGKPGGLAIELTSLNQADKVAPRKAIEIQGAIVERKTADALLKSGQFPNLTKRMIDEAPAHSGWMHPVGMSEAEAQAKFMDDQLKVLSAPKHPLHQLTESYEEIAGHLPNRPMIPQGPPQK